MVYFDKKLSCWKISLAIFQPLYIYLIKIFSPHIFKEVTVSNTLVWDLHYTRPLLGSIYCNVFRMWLKKKCKLSGMKKTDLALIEKDKLNE